MLSPKTIKNVHGVLHKALDKAAELRYIAFNPSDPCTLPRIKKKEVKPLEQSEIAAFLKAVQGSRYENLFTVVLFTGLREGEALGLSWDKVDFTMARSSSTPSYNRQRSAAGTTIWPKRKAARAA